MSKKITDSERISELGSKKKNKSQEIWKVTVNSIKEILTSNWEDVILTDEQIQSIIDDKENCDWLDNYNKEVQYDNVRIITNYLRNMDRTKIKDYIHRKKEYLEKNRTISKEKFEELFWWNGKYWKAEINQWALGICYAYSWLELLKKTNWFDEMIQTNFRETENWWEVRLPFCDINWKRIKINKTDIDKELPKSYWNGTVNINSKSKYLWFKIIEIAFMKKYIIDNFFTYHSWLLDWEELQSKIEYEKTWDFQLTHNIINKFEGSWMIDYSMELLYWSSIIHNKWEYSLNTSLMDLAFKHHEKWLYKIALQSKIWDKTTNNVKIIRKNLDQLNGDKLLDIIIDENWKESVKFFMSHSYSIEKCYIDKNTWEKRVRVVNPWHTWIKFDIPLEDCKSIFEREVIGIDIDKMFR